MEAPVTLFQNTQTGKIQQWRIWIEPTGDSGNPEVWIEHGLIDGKKQQTHDVIDKGVNEGKANSTSPLEQAVLMMRRRIKKQHEKGYVGDIDQLSGVKFDPLEALPKNLCFYKPKNSITSKKLKELEQSGDYIYTVKRDGMMHIVSNNINGIQIYSRRMDLVTDSYPHLTDPMGILPVGTVLLGEMVFIKNDGTDDFNLVSRICRSDADKAKQRQEEFGKLTFYIFDIAAFNGKELLTSRSYIERRIIIESLVEEINSPHIVMSERIDKRHVDAMREVRRRKLEGLVIFDAVATMDVAKAYTFTGKAERPNVLWKSKPKYEDDFIVRFDPENGIGEYGSGKNHGKLKSVYCYQLDENGQEIFLAKCGGGLTDEERSYYTDSLLFPMVWRVEYDSIQPGTGSLRFPVFAGDRTQNGDKDLHECIMSDAIKIARSEEKKC